MLYNMKLFKKYECNYSIKNFILLLFLMVNMLLIHRYPNIQQSFSNENNNLLYDALTEYRAHICKETLPYSQHQFNLSFVICISDPNLDPRLSGYFYINGYAMSKDLKGTSRRYEEHLINVWLTLLDNYPDAVILDLGSNIGVYTLASRAMGNKVIAVDPNPHNHALLFNSLVLNRFDDKSVQIMNPISDGHYKFVGADSDKDDSLDIDVGKSILTMNSITLFDLIALIPEEENTVIIKIDVQGFECKALKEFMSLSKKPKFVPYIQMEVEPHCAQGSDSPCQETFFTEFLPLIEKSGYTPHVPWPISYQELEKTCYFDVLFAHKEAKAFPYWDTNLSKISFQDNSNLT